MLGPEQLVLCAGTGLATNLEERLDAAAEAGFDGVSLFITDVVRAREEGLDDARLRSLLADRGLQVAELDPLLHWVPEAGLGSEADASGEAFFQHGPDAFLELADAVDARSINCALVTDAELPRDLVAEAFAALCDRAAEGGRLVHLEFLPWTQIPNLAAALDVVERAGRTNGGVMLDAWHHFRSGGNAAEVRAAAPRILGVQLDDAPAGPEPDPVAETLRRRLLPGEGDIDLPALVRALRDGGCTAPLGVEVFSDRLVALPMRDAARQAADATRAVLARAGA